MDTRSGEMQVFRTVVETNSFSAASKLLNLTPSAISKLITRIEERLGVLLIQRSTRQMTITNEGKRFYESCVRILDDIEEAEQGISQNTLAPHGLLRINVSLPFGTHLIIPTIPEFAQRFPNIILDLSLSDALVDLHREQVDVAIRIGPLADASFHARNLGRSRRVVVAAPEYITAHGHPRTPKELASHRCFNFNFRRSLDEWPFLIDGHTLHIPVRGGILTNNGESMRQLTLQGMGISRLGIFHVAEDLRAGRLLELLPEYNPGDEEEINVIFSNQRYMPARVRVFIDFLLERVAPQLKTLSS